jgi:uncharacterized protein (DUF1778 family)
MMGAMGELAPSLPAPLKVWDDGTDQVQLSERDSLRVRDLLANPPAPNAKLLEAARALPKRA